MSGEVSYFNMRGLLTGLVKFTLFRFIVYHNYVVGGCFHLCELNYDTHAHVLYFACSLFYIVNFICSSLSTIVM